MNCFEWQNRSSDYLDGALIGPEKRQADDHLESCKKCSEQHRHYRLILTTLASQPRSTLPVPIRRSPFSAALPKLDLGVGARLSRTRWEQVPWWIRTTVEGTSIVLLILLGISAGPKVRALYERSIERNLTEFNDAFNASDDPAAATAANVPLARRKPTGPGASTEGDASGDGAPSGDEFAGSEGSDAEDDTVTEVDDGGGSSTQDEREIRVGASEIWRFNLKTDSPHEVRPRIVQLLTELDIPSSTPGLGGIEAPGGIQFDLFVPQGVVANLKKQLQKLAPPAPEGLITSTLGDTFTWYKNKSKHKVPSGQTHVVIWLSQM